MIKPLYDRLITYNQNISFSPYSISPIARIYTAPVEFNIKVLNFKSLKGFLVKRPIVHMVYFVYIQCIHFLKKKI